MHEFVNICQWTKNISFQFKFPIVAKMTTQERKRGCTYQHAGQTDTE